jgi:hypothetical protein
VRIDSVEVSVIFLHLSHYTVLVRIGERSQLVLADHVAEEDVVFAILGLAEGALEYREVGCVLVCE